MGLLWQRFTSLVVWERVFRLLAKYVMWSRQVSKKSPQTRSLTPRSWKDYSRIITYSIVGRKSLNEFYYQKTPSTSITSSVWTRSIQTSHITAGQRITL